MSEEAVDVGDDQGDGGVHRRMGGGEEDSVDWLSFVVPADVEGIIIVRWGGRGGCLLYTSPSPRD